MINFPFAPPRYPWRYRGDLGIIYRNPPRLACIDWCTASWATFERLQVELGNGRATRLLQNSLKGLVTPYCSQSTDHRHPARRSSVVTRCRHRSCPLCLDDHCACELVLETYNRLYDFTTLRHTVSLFWNAIVQTALYCCCRVPDLHEMAANYPGAWRHHDLL